MSDILVLYYSRDGHVAQMASLIAKGVSRVPGSTAIIRTVPELGADPDITPEQGHIYCTKDELRSCSGLALGSPTRFGNMAAPLKAFIDTTSDIWISGSMIDKPACVFSASSSQHGGQESTLLSMMLPLLHHGMIMMGLPYSENGLLDTDAGGTPYGPTVVAGANNDRAITDIETKLCIAMGQRIARIAKGLTGLPD
jgi:NAD(P)H dehydrogenase (quinone)